MDLVDLLLHPRKAAQRYSPLTEGLTEGQANELAFIFGRVREGEHRMRIEGERVYESHDPAIRAAYAQDLMTFPSGLDKLIKRVPGAVVLPKTRGELGELLNWSKANGVPLVPRGGGTSATGGAVPTEGGVVVDMRGFRDVVDIDEAAGLVRVEAGVTWLALDEALAAKGLELRCMPTTAPASTVGGFVAAGGGGLGSFKNGPVRASLTAATVLTPAGTITTFEGDELDLVEGCQGTTGFILDVTLRVDERTERVPVGAAFDTIDGIEAALDALGRLDVASVLFYGPEFVDLKQEALSVRELPKGKFTLLAHATTGSADAVAQLLGKHAGEVLKDGVARNAWDQRFQFLPFKRFGPTVAQADAVIDRGRLAKAYKAGAKALLAPEWAIWGTAVSADEVLLTAYVLADERMPAYPLAAANTPAFIDAVKDKGGRAYQAGLLLTHEAKRVLGRDRVRALAKWQKANDKQQLMNPGKVTGATVKGTLVLPLRAAMAPGEPILKSMRGQFEHRRESTAEPSIKALRTVYGRRFSPRLARIGDELYKCSRTGTTNTLGGLDRELRFETQRPRGIVSAARAILQGHRPTWQLGSHALTLPAVPTYDRNSQNGVPILAAIEAVREAAQRCDGLAPQLIPLVDAVRSEGNVLGKPQAKRGDWMPGGAPAGIDTTTLLLAGDTGAYERADDAGAAFNALVNAGFGFGVLGENEVHAGTTLYRLGAFEAAADQLQALAEAADKHFRGTLPKTLLTLSSEDADVLRRRTADLLEGSERSDWAPGVVTLPEVLASLVADGRLGFKAGAGDDADADAEGADETEAAEEGAEQAGGDDEEDGAEEQPAEEAAEEAAEEDADDDADAAVEMVKAVVVHSPFATEAERDALVKVVEAIPAVDATVLDTDQVLIPDAGFALLYPEDTKRYVGRLKELADGAQVVVGCVDLANTLSKAKGLDVAHVAQLVVEHMEVREGAGAVDVQAGPADEEGMKEFDIPDGAHRIELVKQNAAIPVHPDESILDAAEALGFELPFDCRAGSCVTCCAKWEGTAPDQSEGQVLSEDEQKQFVLTCIAKPKGDARIWSNEQP